MIVGVGVDVCSVDRFSAAAARPGFLERVLHPDERAGSAASQAGRWAVKEAFAKALGAPSGLAWLDCHVIRTESGRPVVETTGTVRSRMTELGVSTVHVSISHDAGVALAMVVCEGEP
nr:holo-ACP synthase [Propionibacterium sp.]